VSERGPQPVAVIGAGRMGAAMIARLRAAGHPVAVHNRTAARAQRVAADTGASPAGSPAQAAASARVVLVSLADDDAVRSAYTGERGLVAGLRAGSLVLETSTIDPQTVRDLAGPVAEAGGTLLDTPVSGSVSTLEQGGLTFMVGGDEAALERARPVLAPLGTKVFHLGELGAGAAMKLAVNALLLGLNQGLAEALVLAERAGIARESAYEVFASGAVAAPFVQYKRESFLHPEGTAVAFMLDLAAKDLDLAATLAGRVGARTDQLTATRAVIRRAIAAGLGEADLSAIAQLLRREADGQDTGE
jgi:3-hydroxyisobutyrate dehydrogenase-like beta-hydroxyacid dehydrogenase